jgi:hypothetical protein
MTNTEIKKLYTQTKKAYEKRTGRKYTWVMNAKQQRLGTATVLAGFALDLSPRVYTAAKRLANFEQDWSELEADYIKRAQDEIRENQRHPDREPRTFWQERTTPEALARSKQSHFEELIRQRDRAVEEIEKRGNWDEYYRTELAEAQELLNSPEVQSFLEAIGGSAELQINDRPATDRRLRNAEMYVRFHYQATEN